MIAPAAAFSPDPLVDALSVPAVHLVIPARSENVSLVRHALAGLGEAMGMDEEALTNLKTVVTEACTNAVVHAYDEGEDGTIEVLADPRPDALEVTVRDFGHGFRPRAVRPNAIPSLRLGLALIAALSTEFELRATPGGGTELTVLVGITSNAEPDLDAAAEPRVAATRETVVSVDDDALASVIVSRVVSSLAARAQLSVDRLSDALLLSDAVSSEGGDVFVEGRTRMAIEETDGNITVRVGPLRDGTGERMLAGLEIPSLGASLASLADEARVELGPDGEHLMLRIAARDAKPAAGTV
jgi:serine/threonine-protein kinase RsbW